MTENDNLCHFLTKNDNLPKNPPGCLNPNHNSDPLHNHIARSGEWIHNSPHLTFRIFPKSCLYCPIGLAKTVCMLIESHYHGEIKHIRLLVK